VTSLCLDSADPAPAIPTLETRRLWLRPLTLANAGPIRELFPRWEITAGEWHARRSRPAPLSADRPR
jgi:hypothetical protein